MKITEGYVYMTFSLPKGPLEVIEVKNETTGHVEFKTLPNHWKENWSNYATILKSEEMIEMMESQVDIWEEFKKNFITFIVSTFLCRNQRGRVNYLILNALLDLHKVRRMNRGQYTMRVLITSVDD